MSFDVVSWWVLLCTVSALNVIAWCAAAVILKRRQIAMPLDTYRTRRLLLGLSAGYVAGCAFRALFPVFDVPRLGLVDSWLSSVLLGRSVATVAELCFVGQWALMLRANSRATDSVVGNAVSWALVPLIALAELCSWYSVLTTSNLGHIMEESLWALSATLLLVSLMGIWPRCAANWRPVLVACLVASAAYVAFMVLVDVPMYWSRWIADHSNGHHSLGIVQGLHDVATRRIISFRWEDWKNEIPWMSLYFSVAVWISIALVNAPIQHSGDVSRTQYWWQRRQRIQYSKYGIS
jgi:hypothetical protein